MLSKAELTLMAKLLKNASNAFVNNGCNNLEIPNTRENRKIVQKVEKLDNEEIKDRICGSRITTCDFALISFLAERCEEELK